MRTRLIAALAVASLLLSGCVQEVKPVKLETLQDLGMVKPVLVIGFEDEFTEHGDPNLLMQQYGLTAAGIQKRIHDAWPETQAMPALRRVV